MSDVARRAGVSTMTVSRVLSGTTQVSDAVREKVLSAVAELRYQPNELARSLRARRTRQIGLVVPYLFDPFFAICAHAISTVAKQHAYSVLLATSNEDPQAEFEEATRLMRRNVEGLILIPAHRAFDSSLMLAQEFERLPIVTLDRPIEGSRFDSLLVDNQGGARLATQHLISLGHERIHYIGLSDELYTMEMRHGAYRSTMEAAGLKPQSVIVTRALESSCLQVRALLSGKRPPTAFFCANNLVTRHVLHGLHSLQIHPPEQVALVGFDDFETADLIRPGITVVRQPVELLGRTAAEVLFSRLNATTTTKAGKRRTLPVELLVRGSCGASSRASLATPAPKPSSRSGPPTALPKRRSVQPIASTAARSNA
ncbi:MAG TPA: LacI family DNA-binding transcriptional regulator [Acidobacteriaceae bacterium]